MGMVATVNGKNKKKADKRLVEVRKQTKIFPRIFLSINVSFFMNLNIPFSVVRSLISWVQEIKKLTKYAI